ncbi:protein decapping 5-like [Melia azedarach]|uniref:Protein decapping 5-like n=2 Tax=Melia azedarach TaxID=155640 RepID=A0ACC1XA65_MELAZ|nr:protein decapping 5-like [Melia azedarach]KAJ4707145.1 protein decapping 5-like [Melia azedarach]
MATAATATEAPRSSSSGSADSYIGSLISLTSKSEIRYEGVLFNINTEESSIGLRNVRSFGTEGRRNDGPQVPPSDKIYEYILFRGSDIKDLQVKSSPPVQTAASIHNDPAIIQSHYSQVAIASTSLPSGSGSVPDPTSQTSQIGLSRPTFPGSPALYQPSGNLGAWGPSPLPTSNGLAMPMYWQGFYGSSNGLPPQQQHLLQPPPGLSMLPSMQQSMQYPPMNASLPTGASNLPASQLSELRPPLMPPISTGTINLLPPILPAQSSAPISDSLTNLIPDKASTQTLPTAPSTSLPLVPPLSTSLDNTAIAPPVSEPKSVSGPKMPFQSMSEPASSIAGMSSSILNDGIMPSLVTPGQLLQPGLPAVSSSQTSQTAQKDVEIVRLSSSEAPPGPIPAAAPPPPAAATEAHEPILPLPSTTERKPHGAPTYTQHSYRGGRGRARGRGRGRGNELSRSATRFTEDFDFTAMNEKFNKDEVWDHLGKSNKAQEDGDNYQDEEDVGSSKYEAKPVYVKDDFFDSLSCDALDGGSRNGRTRFSEQVKRDTETFGNFPRYHGSGRGGRGPYRGGRSRGSYHGTGYGYAPRGRGYGTSRNS